MWGKEKLVKYQQFSNYCVHHCLLNFLSIYRSLSTASIVKTVILAVIYFIFLKKNILDQTWKPFETKFWPQRKDWKRIYEVRQNLELFCNLVALIVGQNCVKGITVIKFLKKTTKKTRGLEIVSTNTMFPETTKDKTFEKNSNLPGK